MPAVPLVAVTSSEVRASMASTVKPEADPPRDEMVLGMRYLQALSGFGCMPVVVPPVGVEHLEAFLDRVDGICLSGGPDLTPGVYGATPDPMLGPTEPALDQFELALAAAADRRGMPILAICRGLQLLNVVRGGTLHQHVPDVYGTTIEHRQHATGTHVTHEVRLAGDSRSAGILGTDVVAVNSFHHQAIDALGDGLAVVGLAPDGVIEVVEDPSTHFVVGVQWHAESLTMRPEGAALYRAFAAACVEARDGRAAQVA